MKLNLNLKKSLDRLINNSGNTLNELFQKDLSIEQSIKQENPSYNSQMVEHIKRFKELNGLYKH